MGAGVRAQGARAYVDFTSLARNALHAECVMVLHVMCACAADLIFVYTCFARVRGQPTARADARMTRAGARAGRAGRDTEEERGDFSMFRGGAPRSPAERTT